MFNTNTIAIIDYRMKSPMLAKIIVSYTGDIDRQFIHDSLVNQFDGLAAPVKASFKKIQDGVAVGFLRANRAVRAVSEKELKAYRVMSSNMIMDEADKSLWEVKSGSSGKYLARHGQEDLSALVSASRMVRTDLPKLRDMTIARAAAAELVSFVDDSGDLDHGFAFATNDEKVRVVSFARRQALTVDYDNVVSIQPVPVPQSIRAQVIASLTSEEKKQANAYWTRLYSYAPEYLREVVKQVNEGTMA